jgi:hypothetical protein
MFRGSAITALLVCSSLAAQDSRTILLAASSSGVVELIDPLTLGTVGRIHFDFGPQRAGLNGVSASADGSLLYVEGPIPDEPHGCCVLYSIDLATLQVKVAASVPGSVSRNAFVASDGLVYPAATLTPNGIPRGMVNDRLHLSPGGRWLVGVRSFLGPALDVYDVGRGQVAGQLTPEGLEGDWWPTGVWSGDRFYLYAASSDGSGRLWNVAPETPQLGDGVFVAPIGRLAGCPDQSSKAMAAAAGMLLLYEEFGFKLDRRNRCAGSVPGGAWVVDPATGELTRRIAPDMHFAALLPDQEGSRLYGLSPGGPNWERPQLVRIDLSDGRILQSRDLDPGFWRIAIAPLRSIPSGDVHATLASGMR